MIGFDSLHWLNQTNVNDCVRIHGQQISTPQRSSFSFSTFLSLSILFLQYCSESKKKENHFLCATSFIYLGIWTIGKIIHLNVPHNMCRPTFCFVMKGTVIQPKLWFSNYQSPIIDSAQSGIIYWISTGFLLSTRKGD